MIFATMLHLKANKRMLFFLKPRNCFTIFIIIILKINGLCQDVDSLNIFRNLSIDTVTVSSGQIFKTGTMTKEILTDSFLRRSVQGTLSNMLDKLPGMSAINTGVGISKPVIRGLSFQRIIVNHNGIKQEGQQWGADHGLEIDQFDVDRIEILKGPVSLLYGSDGLGGVINILPMRIPTADV